MSRTSNSPLHVLHELLHGLHDHRTAPHDGGVVVDEKSHAHHLHAETFHRHQHRFRAFTFDFGASREAHHQWHARTINIAIHQPDPIRASTGAQHLSERARQVHRKRALAHATFAGGNRNGVFDFFRRATRARKIAA